MEPGFSIKLGPHSIQISSMLPGSDDGKQERPTSALLGLCASALTPLQDLLPERAFNLLGMQCARGSSQILTLPTGYTRETSWVLILKALLLFVYQHMNSVYELLIACKHTQF